MQPKLHFTKHTLYTGKYLKIKSRTQEGRYSVSLKIISVIAFFVHNSYLEFENVFER
jgi:hypothetical protein